MLNEDKILILRKKGTERGNKRKTKVRAKMKTKINARAGAKTKTKAEFCKKKFTKYFRAVWYSAP